MRIDQLWNMLAGDIIRLGGPRGDYDAYIRVSDILKSMPFVVLKTCAKRPSGALLTKLGTLT
jgi:hypothetical protein